MKDCKVDSNIKIRDSIISNNSEITGDNISTHEKIFLLGEGSKIKL